MTGPDWRKSALCGEVGWYLFFLDSLIPEARAVCARCPVTEECRTAGWAEEAGVWGGLDAIERAKRRS